VLGYYSVIKKNEIMSFAEKWTEQEIIMLSETGQTEKDKYCILSQMMNLDLKKMNDTGIKQELFGR
jgi:hypothetical protein